MAQRRHASRATFPTSAHLVESSLEPHLLLSTPFNINNNSSLNSNGNNNKVRKKSVARKSLRPDGSCVISGVARRARDSFKHNGHMSSQRIPHIDRAKSSRAGNRKQPVSSITRPRPLEDKNDLHFIHPEDRNHLFAWEHAGLGLEMDVSSGTTSEEPPVVTADNYLASAPDATVSAMHNTTRIAGSDFTIPQPDQVWVRNLVVLRRAVMHRVSVKEDDIARQPTAKQWLREQHRALEEGAILVTLKCVLAASGVSKLFTACAADFMRPEYRSRYWDWSMNFVRLVDFYITHEDVDVLSRQQTASKPLVHFIRAAIEQRREGRLSPHKEALLTAIGIQWSEGKLAGTGRQHSGIAESPVSSKSPKSSTSPRSSGPAARAKWRSKRQRRHVPVDGIVDDRRPFITPPAVGQAYVAPDRDSVEQWSRCFAELRQYYLPDRGYDIPGQMPYLRIWMNAEAARSYTGTLSVFCCGVLRAARVIESMEAVRITPNCDRWCRCFVEFVDHVIATQYRSSASAVRKLSNRLVEFVAGCVAERMDRSLCSTREALLTGVLPNWVGSRLARDCVDRVRASRKHHTLARADRERTNACVHKARDATRRKRSRENEVEVVDMTAEGTAQRQEWVREKEMQLRPMKRRKQAAVCERMVSSMIKGIVAESTGGRQRTEDEVDAEAWVEEVGVEALNRYAQKWFRSAGID